MTRQASGQAAEAHACAYLESQGLRLLERNYRCRFGEIDLIMQDGEYLVFVEVRLRRSARFGGALLSVNARKQGRLVASAQCYLQGQRHSRAARFDVVALGSDERLEWVRDAFSICD